MSWRRLRPSPAMAVAMIALFVASATTGYAQVRLARNSVTTIHIKDRSLLARDFRRGQIPRGPAGPQGAAGPAGPQGPAGPAGPSGAAKAFARVLAGGDVDDPRARGINDAAVSKPSAGVYCIDVEGGALNIVASIDVSSQPGIVQVSPLLTTCPSGKEVEVHTRDMTGTLADRAFFVLVN
jgi:hypothetical protein